MHKLKDNKIAVGILAGIVCALLMVVGQSMVLFSTILLTMAFAAIVVAGLSAGALSSLIAVLVAAGAVSAMMSSGQVFINIALTLAPAGLMAYLANFARPADEIGGPDNAMAWYPLSDILFFCAAAVAFSTWITLAMNPMRDALYAEAFTQIKLMMGQLAPELEIRPENEDMLKTMIRLVWPMAQGAELLVLIFAAYYFGIRIVSGFNLGLRPREDIPHALRMNRNAIFPFVGGVLLMAFGGPISEIGACIAGAYGAGFMLSGYAVFHLASRGKSWRVPGLVLAYLLTAIITMPMTIVFLIGGLANTRRAIAITKNRDTSENNH